MRDSLFFFIVSMVMIAPHVPAIFGLAIGAIWFGCAIWAMVGELKDTK
jgi:hypothetical protein